jgi:hypothetical protein
MLAHLATEMETWCGENTLKEYYITKATTVALLNMHPCLG